MKMHLNNIINQFEATDENAFWFRNISKNTVSHSAVVNLYWKFKKIILSLEATK
jgi:hydroxymethylglutaryl-CoA reductase